MTTAQIDRDFEIVWHGRDYLCVFPPPLKAPAVERLILPVDQVPRFTVAEIRQRVVEAMPGSMQQLIARTGCSRQAIYSTMQYLQRAGRLVTSRQFRGRTVYAVVGGRSGQ